jgi:LCP family protein required for cell wall assembly
MASACAAPPEAVPPTPAPMLEPTPATLPLIASGRAGDPATGEPRDTIDLSRLPRWSRGNTVSLMALGVDRRASEPPRSDTMLLATIEMANRRASVVSIPRDLLVDIPGLGKERINAAFSVGEQERPGGGPARARQAVEQNFQVSVPHWAVVDFQCFRSAVDAIGGMYLDVPTGILDREYPDDTYGTMEVSFEPGFQWMDGERALQYARTRHGDSDFGRMRRQQQVLSALRTQLITLQRLPVLPAIMDGCRGFSSDLPLIDLVALAFSARSIPEENIRLTTIDERMTRPSVQPDGAAVLTPDWPEIRSLVRAMLPAMAISH